MDNHAARGLQSELHKHYLASWYYAQQLGDPLHDNYDREQCD